MAFLNKESTKKGSTAEYIKKEVATQYERYCKLVERRGKEPNSDMFELGTKYCRIDCSEYDYDDYQTTVVAKAFVDRYEEKIIRKEQKRLERKTNYDAYQPKYQALAPRAEALGGKLKTKDGHVSVSLPRRRKVGMRDWWLDYNEYDYYFLCSAILELEAAHAERKARVDQEIG